MSDDNLRDALQGMRQPQPGIVYIADVLAYVEPRLAEVRQLTDRCEHLRQMLETTAIERGEFRNDRERARDAAVFLEQENARLTERITAAAKRARTRDEDLLHMRDNSKNAQRTMTRGHAWEVAAYEVRTIAELLDGGEGSC